MGVVFLVPDSKFQGESEKKKAVGTGEVVGRKDTPICKVCQPFRWVGVLGHKVSLVGHKCPGAIGVEFTIVGGR
jgi:hypothetical protein